ncbi:ArsR/SmtB family transcription factor [Planctomycetota bacterium]
MTSVHFDQHSTGAPAMSSGMSGGEFRPSANGTPLPTSGESPQTAEELAVQRVPGETNGRLNEGISKDVANAFKLLADETRLKILCFLVEENELNVRSLCERLAQSQPAVSHHLALMRHAGLIASRRQGKNNFYRLLPQRMTEIRDLVSQLFLKDSDAYRPAV